ncbi:hypothetical protein RvY_16079 [Ramazzottius varieornatus]|uniref:TAF1C beta-propeller domain-containing protein n=1 Tax=Ramazzottius varieornatus TaxID=947166 RepID=A0A1D1VX66_RAMVA|nr:hypothetical protein RvY_16079 [Ramazzottius varieornatus]
MDLPPFVFGDWPVPPAPRERIAHMYDPNKKQIFPAIKDGYYESILEPGPFIPKYGLGAASDDCVLRSISTCIPFGTANRVANLQDLCSQTLPFAIQAQQWLRDYLGKGPVGRPRGSKNKKATPEKKRKAANNDGSESEESGNDNEDENDVDGKNRSEVPSTSTKPPPGRRKSTARKTNDPDEGEDNNITVDPLLPFVPLPSIMEPRKFVPYARDVEKVDIQTKRATARSGFRRLPLLNSRLNWWYSGGCLSYMPQSPDDGIFFYPEGCFSQLKAIPVDVTDKRSFRRIKLGEREIPSMQLKTPIYQVCTHSFDGVFRALIYNRLPDECVVISLDQRSAEAQMKKRTAFPSPQRDYWTHIAPSLQVPGEVLLASMEGRIEMWSVEYGRKFNSFSVGEMPFKDAAPYKWTGCYFGSHPRTASVATPLAVEFFDARLRVDTSKSSLTLLSKGAYEAGHVINDIVAAGPFSGRTSYHVVISTKEILLLDERFPGHAVLRYPSQATTSPFYLRAVADVIGSNGMILAGSQMSQQVFCLETSLGTSGLREPTVARMPSLPFLAATPRQLGPQIIQAGIELPFTVSDRLEKPLIGMDAVVQSGGSGMTIASLTALGDLFLQSFELVDKEGYIVDGNHCYSSVHSEVQLGKKERKHVEQWIADTVTQVADPTMHDFVGPFTPASGDKITEEMAVTFKDCVTEARHRKPHPDCPRCHEVKGYTLSRDQNLPADQRCEVCRMLVKDERTIRHTGPNKFCYIEENNTTEPVKLPAGLQREDRLREMGLSNRIIHRILTKCYGEDLPTAGLQPEEGELPPPIERRSKKSARQEELFQTLLQEAAQFEGSDVVEDEADGDTVILMQPPSQPEPASSRWRGGNDVDEFDDGPLTQMQPLATSTQQEQPAGSSAKKSAKKPKRLMGF